LAKRQFPSSFRRAIHYYFLSHFPPFCRGFMLFHCVVYFICWMCSVNLKCIYSFGMNGICSLHGVNKMNASGDTVHTSVRMFNVRNCCLYMYFDYICYWGVYTGSRDANLISVRAVQYNPYLRRILNWIVSGF
jgi:hypothetical protein